ncbi:MAG: hypothetical protein HY897_04990 [Deltaproteobacteria bacterium]|nr:hypothetical protein [Deltaproteobacteria bacterium]
MKKSTEEKDMSVQEASEYWDEHDFAECGGLEEVKDLEFALRKKKYVGIDIRLYAMIRKSARKLRVPEEALINKWLRERV